MLRLKTRKVAKFAEFIFALHVLNVKFAEYIFAFVKNYILYLWITYG